MWIMNNLNYSFAVGYVRALEAKLLPDACFLKLKQSVSLDQFKNVLKSFNYNFINFTTFTEFSLKLNSSFCGVVDYLIKICPTKKPFEILFFKNDCHNLKVILLANLLHFNFSNLILKPRFLPVHLLENCVVSKSFESMPVYYKNLALGLIELCDEGIEKFEIENFYNKMMFKTKLQMSSNLSYVFLKNRTRIEIDLFNLNLVLKVLNLNLGEDVLKNSLVEGGFLNSYFIIKSFNAGVDSLCDFLNLELGIDFSKLLKSPNLFFEFAVERLMNFESSQANLPFSFAAIASYLTNLNREHELLKKFLIQIVKI